MNILFTRELARRVAGTGVTVNCLHPGFVATRFGDSSGALMSFVIRAAKLFAASPADGAATIIYLASSAEVEGISGTYFRRCRPITPSLDAQNDADAQQLWDTSVKLSGLEP